MNRSLLVAALLAVALAACSKKEEATTAQPAPAVVPAQPAAVQPAATDAAAKPADSATLTAQPQPAPAADSKPAN